MVSTAFRQADWRNWIVASLRQSCTNESMVAIAAEMTRCNFHPRMAHAVVAKLAQEVKSAKSLAGETGPTLANRIPATVSSSRIPQANELQTGDRQVPVMLRLASPEVIVLGNVLTDAECDELIARSRAKLARSTTIDPQTGACVVIGARTSFGTHFKLAEDEFITRIEQRLASLLSWPADHSEGLQAILYREGGEYTPHFDYFPPTNAGSAAHLAKAGQRIATLVMYLNNVEEGGETIFPEIGLSVVPRRGQAVYFSYCDPEGRLDPLTLHGGAPVRRGEKWIATKWLRERPWP